MDILYCHRYDPETPVTETLRAIDDLIRQGKVLYAGISEWSAAQIEEAMRVADRYLLDRIVVNQPKYNMLHRAIEKDVLPVSQKHGVGQVVFSPLAQGLLTGKYKSADDIPADSRAASSKMKLFHSGIAAQGCVCCREQAARNCRRSGHSLWRSLRWPGYCGRDGISSALIGASRPAQVEENVKASGFILPEDALKQIDEALQ